MIARKISQTEPDRSFPRSDNEEKILARRSLRSMGLSPPDEESAKPSSARRAPVGPKRLLDRIRLCALKIQRRLAARSKLERPPPQSRSQKSVAPGAPIDIRGETTKPPRRRGSFATDTSSIQAS